jgi:RNA polymerase sigma-70 factor (ECF subfamily)
VIVVSESSVMNGLAEAGVDLAALGVTAEDVVRYCRAREMNPAFVADAALALGCARGHGGALTEFDRRYGREFAGALSRLRLDHARIDDITQLVREKLFVAGADRPARILEYGGKGPLVSWLRAVIVRSAIDFRRHEGLEPQPTDDGEPLVDAAQPSDDPELENIRARYAVPFREALRDAVRALDADERNALRLHVAEDLSLDDIARIYGVHRATVARWIQSARDTLLKRTKRLLEERLRLSPHEFESLVRLCQSRLELSFSEGSAEA